MSSGSEYESDEEDFHLDAVDIEHQEDFLKYAADYLNINIQSDDADLAWVAWEAFTRPPPDGWSEHTHPNGRVYFHNWATRESTWSHPDDEMFKSLLGIVKALRAERPFASEARRSEVMQDHVNQIYKAAEEDLKNWSGPYSKEGGGDYFYNEILKESVWENPSERWERQLATRQSVLHRCLLSDWPHALETPSKESPISQVRSLADASDAITPSFPQREEDELSAQSAKSQQTMHSCRSFRTARSDRSTRSVRSARSPRSQTPRGKRSSKTSSVPPPLPPATLPATLRTQSEYLPRFGAVEDESLPLQASLQDPPKDLDTEEAVLPDSERTEKVDIDEGLSLDAEEKSTLEEAKLQGTCVATFDERKEGQDKIDANTTQDNDKAVASHPTKSSSNTLESSLLERRKATADFGSPPRKKTSDDLDLGSPALAVPALDLRLKNALDAFIHNSHSSLELDPFVNPEQRPRAWSAVEQYPSLRCDIIEGRLKVFKEESLPVCDNISKGDVVDNADVAGGLAVEKIVADCDLVKNCSEDECSDMSTMSQLSGLKKGVDEIHGTPSRHPYGSPTGSSRSSNNVQFFNIYDVEAVEEDGNEVDKVRQWLRKLGLGRYFEQLELQGFDNMNILATLNEEQFVVLMGMVPMPYLHEQQLRRGLARLDADVRSDEVKVSSAT